MEVGELKAQVSVTAETPLLEAATASLGQVVDRQRIRDLPVAHGNAYLLMALSPGLVYTQNPGLDEPFAPIHIVGYSMDRLRANLREITLHCSSHYSVNNR